jgi:hypothetical protein
MSVGMGVLTRNARLQAIVDQLDANVSAGYINFYDGFRPTTGSATTTQTLLATTTLSIISGLISNAVLTFSTINADLSVDADGLCSWCRFFDGGNNFVLDMTCGLSGSGAEFIFNNTSFITGGSVVITSAAITEGNP